MDGYYIGDNIPEIFLLADEKIKSNRKENDHDNCDKSTKKEKKEKINKKKSDKETKKKDKKKNETKKEKVKIKSKKEYEIEIIQLLSRMELYTRKLEKLDPGKRKDSAKIANYNIEIRNIKARLDELEMESGIVINDLTVGTKLGRFWVKVKRIGKKIKKKSKKFFKHNQELVIGIIAIAAPVISAIIAKAVLHV